MPIKRLFTAGSLWPQDNKALRTYLDVCAPADWNLEAIETFKEAMAPRVPLDRCTLEENTMPSWLWRHKAHGEATTAETDVSSVIDRIVGAATYRGWKNSLWKNEAEASAFFDETRTLLLSRRLVLAPESMARMGLAWAYGQQPEALEALPSIDPAETTNLLLQNETIDAIFGGQVPAARGKWMRFLESSQKRERASVAFIDTMTEWHTPGVHAGPRALLNLLAFRAIDGSLDVAGLEQATRLSVLLLELHYETIAPATKNRPLAIGFANLSSLLMSLGFAYNSELAQSTASAIAALITATACETSAKLAAKLGPCGSFMASREALVRNLENQIRAAFGEKTDYDRLSVLPEPLDLESGVDLVLLSTARHTYEKAIDLVRMHGLRHGQLTALFHDSAMGQLAEAYSQGVEAEAALACDFAVAEERFERRVNPAVPLALAQKGYDKADIKAVCEHLTGYRTLRAAPGISLTALREKGFSDEALERLEAYLPFVGSIKHAFTPAVLGAYFCRDELKISEKNLSDPSFDMLRWLGFSSKEITMADGFCCGHKHVAGIAELAESDRALFATQDDLAPEALIQMAASVQSFIMGDVSLTLAIPAEIAAQVRGELLLMGWKKGLRSLTLLREGQPLADKAEQPFHTLIKRKTLGHRAALTSQEAPKVAGAASRSVQKKASPRSLALKTSGTKPGLKEKRN